MCQNIQKVDHQGAEDKSFFETLNEDKHWS